jgi:DNA-binding transcriptional LysR family regulator
MMAQASAGLGLAYVGECMVADDIASGGLVEALSEWTPLLSRILPLLSQDAATWPRACAPTPIWKEMVFRNRAAS